MLVRLLLLGFLFFLAYRALARFQVRRIRRNARPGIDRSSIAELQYWAETPWSPVRREARRYWAELVAETDPELAETILRKKKPPKKG